MTHVLIFVKSLDAFNLSEVEDIKGFDRGIIFTEHLESIGYGNLFPRSGEQGEESHSV